MIENTVIVGIPGSGRTTSAREIATEHVANGGHLAVLILNEHHEREWAGIDRALVTTIDRVIPTARDLMEARISSDRFSERLSLPRVAATPPLLLVVDPADHLDGAQWEMVERIAERGRGTGVTVVVTAHRRSEVPSRVRDNAELIELERRAA